jgi:hypothetical protein
MTSPAFSASFPKTHPDELIHIGALNCPKARDSILALFLNKKKAVRIDLLKANDGALQCNARRGVELSERMMRRQRGRRREHQQ